MTAVLVLSLGSITIAAPAVSEEIILTEEPTDEMPDYEESAETPILIPEEPADEMPLPDFEESAETPLQLMEDSGAGEGTPAKRTIMMYICGSNLESRYSMASYNQLWEAKGADAAEKQAELEGKINDLTEQIGSLTEKH